MRTVWAALCAALAAGSGATVKTRTVSYKQGGTVLKGYVAYDDARADKRSWEALTAFLREMLGE